jgi:hypothetical protein
MAAAGDEAVTRNLNLAIDPEVDRIVSEAGVEAGLALRKRYLLS